MSQYGYDNFRSYPHSRTNFVYPIVFLWGIVAVSVLSYIWYDYSLSDPNYRYYLVPWCFLTGAAVAAPSVYLYYKDKFNPFNPLIYAAWIYFFPAFFLGGLVLSAGLFEPYYLAFVQDERTDLPLTLVYVIMGYVGLTIGYFLPFGKKLGKAVGDRLPVWDWRSKNVTIPAMLLLAIGFFNTALAFIYGILGYQRSDEIGIFDGLLFLTTLWGVEASFLLWLIIFRSKNINVNHYIIIAILIVSTFAKSAFQGNRGSLIFFFVMIACAFVLSGRKIRLKHKMLGAVFVSGALIIGMVYGTTFRSVKSSHEQVSFDLYAENVYQTFEKVSDRDLSSNLSQGFSSLAERIESVSPLAVVVSNYEKLKPYEESYGLDNNIWKDTVTFFIPRIIWHDKPVASESFKYSDLYFNFGENAFAVTPMGDLLRNFGPVGVPLGMIVLGFLIRLIYASLIEEREFSYWRATVYYMLLTNLSYEGFYGSIVPYLVKVGFISIVGIIFIRIFISSSNKRQFN